MGDTGIQQRDAINAYSRLLPTDLSVDAGRIDPGNLVPVYPVDPKWLGMEPFILVSLAAVDINGAIGFMDDTDPTRVLTGEAPVVAENRFYVSCGVLLDGTGTIDPLEVAAQWRVAFVADNIISGAPANPGRIDFTSVVVPAGYTLRLTTRVNGGAGDTCRFYFRGFKAPTGVPLPYTGAIGRYVT